MLTSVKNRLKVLSMYNYIHGSNTPLEPFLLTNKDKFGLYIVALYQDGEDAKEELENLYPGANVTATGLGANRVSMASALLRMIHILREIRPDIIHVNHTASGILGSFTGRFFTQAKILTTVHNDFRYYRRLQKLLWFLTYLLSHCIVCNSINTKTSVMEAAGTFLRRKRIFVCYNGVDYAAIDESVREQNSNFQIFEPGDFVIGAVGRLIEQKGFDVLLKAFATLRKRLPEIRLVIAGDGVLRSELESMANILSISESVVFAGNLGRRSVYSLLARIDVFVVSSRWEGFCNAMVEAMVAGKAIVASCVGPLPEVLGRDCGLFFASEDVRGMCQNLDRLYNDSLLRKELSGRARLRALTKFGLEECARNYEKIYENLYFNTSGIYSQRSNRT